jgi:hypothetical protein
MDSLGALVSWWFMMGWTVSGGEAKEMAALATELLAEVKRWIRAEHPELL